MLFRPLLWPTVFGAVGLAVLIGLGTWQMQRLAWKTDLIARASARVEAAPVPLPASEWPGIAVNEWEYRPVRVSGVYDYGEEAYVFTSLPNPKGRFGGPGYLVFTRLKTDGGDLLVNRGFVPEDLWKTQRRHGHTDGSVTIEGLIRAPEPAAWFAPNPDLAEAVWFTRDSLAMARHLGLTASPAFYLDATRSSLDDLPQGGETRLTFRNAHLEYALTWYGLALALIAVYLAYHRSEGRLGRPRSEDRS